MHRSLPAVIRSSLVAVLACASLALGQEKAGIGKALEMFFELGLPDAKKGRWVRISLYDSSDVATMPGGYNARYSGNAWLLREEKGIVEAVTSDGRRIFGKKSQGEDAVIADDGLIPPVVLEPADLDSDLQVFTAALTDPLGGRDSGDSEDSARQKAVVAAGSLLFLAQLQHQGRADFVREALPRVLAIASSREKALDGAVTLLADEQIAGLGRDWNRNGDAKAYAAGIEALAARFPRGWEHRDAAGLLLARLREQTPAPLAGDPDARQAADFLLKLKPAQFGELPRGWNWFISAGGGGRRYGRFPMGGEDDEAEAKPMKKDSAVAAFFARKREAAQALAKLLDDRRYVRCSHRADQQSRYRYSYGDRQSREEIIRGHYDQLSRPYEMGELAWDILSPLLPEQTRGEAQQKPATRAALALAWVKSVAAKSDEELAWDCLRAANSTYDEAFRGGLRFLTEHGGPETLAKLTEVFFDPGVWNDSSLAEMIPHVESYVKRAPADAAFPDKLRAAAKAGFDAEEAENSARFSGPGMEEMKKQMTGQRAAQMKQLDRIFKPPQPIAEQLAEILAMEETEALAVLEATGEVLAKKPRAEIESPVFQAAAKAKSPAIKRQMIQILMGAVMNGMQARALGKGGAAPSLPAGAPTRDALLALLRDETLADNDWNPAAESTVADFTAAILLVLYGSPAAQEKWQSLGQSAPHLATRWLRTHSIALASGQPAPPFPNAANIPANQAAALIRELGALTAKDVPTALDAKTPDEQLAIVTQLVEAPEWPASLAEAQFTVRSVAGKNVAELGAVDWKGRRFDEKLVRDIETAMAAAAVGGKTLTLFLEVRGALAGVGISVGALRGAMPLQQLEGMGLPGLAGKPSPAGTLVITLRRGGDGDAPGDSVGFGFPVWKDEAATRAWREAHGKPAAAAKPKDDLERRDYSADPAAFDAKLRECLSLKQGTRGPLQLVISATAIGEPPAAPRSRVRVINN